MTETYNINELLEKKKQLEEREKEIFNEVTAISLEYLVEKTIDHKTPKNNRETIPRQKVSLNEYCQIYNGTVDELAKVKTAIQKFNTENILGELYNRDNTRKKIAFLQKVKENIPTEVKRTRGVKRQDSDGVALETVEVTAEPMFERVVIDKLFDELAAQERKTNTEIQKKNLNAKVSL